STSTSLRTTHGRAWMSSSTPSIAELRAVTQPESVLGRPGAEHWAGRLYMRRLSPYLTRLLIRTPLSPTAVTALMIPVGLAAAFSLTLPGLLGAIGAVLLAQAQLLLDCCDGELARWRRQFSATGTYVDQLAHYGTEAALVAALGVRADGGWGSIGGWTALGLLVSVLILLLKAETHLAEIALARSGKAVAGDPSVTARTPRGRLRLREGARLVPFFRPYQAIEATLLALAAAVVDAVAGGLVGTRVLLVGLVCFGVVAVVGHGGAVLRSSRLG
ncbi:MAG: CDP-alcohol phosphatidyltransferase family protein, partial [Actinobacteria bacterium]|nr:CDP-alcohol phosphatidyltransferase family protein [Actinomycetota bacterium]